MKNAPFFAVYLTYWLAYAALYPYLGLFYVERGFSGRQIAAFSIAEAVVTPVMSLLIGLLMARTRRTRRVLALLPALCCLAAAGLYFAGTFPLTLLCVALLCTFQPPVNDVCDRLLIHRLRAHPERYSRYRLGGSVGYGIGVVIAGSLYLRWGHRSSFALYTAAILAAAFFCTRIPQGDAPESADAQERFSLRRLRPDRWFFFLYGAMVLYGIVESAYGKFMMIYAAGQGVSTAVSSTLVAAAMAGEMSMFLLFPLITARLSPTRQIALSFALCACRVWTLTWIGRLPAGVVLLGQFLGGGAFSIISTAETVLIGCAYPGKEGYTAQALKNIANSSVGYAVGSAILGELYQRGRLRAGYTGIAVLPLACAALYFLLSLEKRTGGSPGQ